MTSTGTQVQDQCYDRITALSLGIPVLYKAAQNSAVNSYILFLDDDERYAQGFSDKDKDANDIQVTLQIWGSSARTNATIAKSIIDDLCNKENPPTVNGFDYIKTDLERNQLMPQLTTDGEASQFARVIRIRFIYRPSA